MKSPGWGQVFQDTYGVSKLSWGPGLFSLLVFARKAKSLSSCQSQMSESPKAASNRVRGPGLFISQCFLKKDESPGLGLVSEGL